MQTYAAVIPFNCDDRAGYRHPCFYCAYLAFAGVCGACRVNARGGLSHALLEAGKDELITRRSPQVPNGSSCREDSWAAVEDGFDDLKHKGQDRAPGARAALEDQAQGGVLSHVIDLSFTCCDAVMKV